MRWNWQQPDWPNFTWSASRLAKAEEQFLVQRGFFLGKTEHLQEGSHELLTVEAIRAEACTTSEIEGEILDRDSVQSSVRRQLGLAVDSRRVSPAEHGIAEMMVELYRGSEDPLDLEQLNLWHGMICNGRRDLRNIGNFRTHEEPMQVVSGTVYEPRIHFEAPPSTKVPVEMNRFVEWFAETSATGSRPLPALTRAGIAHLYFESIHPYEDGNGRIGRAIVERALTQGLGRASLVGVATAILYRQRSYYDALEAANKSNEITDWLAWMAGTILEAQRRTQAQVEFLIDKARYFDRLRGQLNGRQEAALLRMFREGLDGFTGGLSASNYVSITKASTATATRDLADLVEKVALRRTGEKKHTRYHLAIPLRPIPRIMIDGDGNILES